MKTKTSLGLAMLSAITALMILAPSTVAASQSSPLTLQVQGIITNGGNQLYNFAGGTVVGGEILGTALTTGSSISFQFTASVHGLSTSGSGSISVPTSNSGSGGNGGNGWGNNNGNGGNGWGNNGDSKTSPSSRSSNQGTSVQISITGQESVAVFPLNPDGSSCASQCNSEIPLVFSGVATIQSGGNTVTAPVVVESPYWNPFGGAIFITTTDAAASLSIVVTYTSATILWTGVQLQGYMFGSLGTTQVSGAYSTTSTSFENLFTGVETDAGTMTFAGMTPSSLNAVGGFLGKTTIPPIGTGGSFDCSTLFGFPEGTCTATGASSSGSFLLFAHGSSIKGTYSTAWSVPSLTTTTSVSASVNS
jgi:hypothetical protein